MGHGRQSRLRRRRISRSQKFFRGPFVLTGSHQRLAVFEMNQVEKSRRGIAHRFIFQKKIKSRECFVLSSGSCGRRIRLALELCLGNQSVRGFQPIKIVARIFCRQLAREGGRFGKALLAGIKNDEQRLRFALNPGAFFGNTLQRGQAALERVAKEGTWVQSEAKTLLIVLYTREKRFAEAAAFARELAAKYPRNYLYRLEAADALVSPAALERQTNPTTPTTATENEAFATFDRSEER